MLCKEASDLHVEDTTKMPILSLSFFFFFVFLGQISLSFNREVFALLTRESEQGFAPCLVKANVVSVQSSLGWFSNGGAAACGGAAGL